MRVLLVDDEEEFVTTLAERLTIRGFAVEYATKAADALVLAGKNVYDIAVLDMKMPVIGGLQLREMLERQHPEMKFIFLTGHGSEDDYRAGSTGAGYLVKPVDINILIQKMKEAIEQ
ncbi:MAG: histidine kinase [Desulfobacterales bacterium GWB2_56_26]|nr:MAG: histidine kinase [Desulfobacterales bacterium GWB2_56_26]HBG17704.1 response regulator [Desulfobulbaceae bacterium]